ncbi:septal ring lytic transglycosylase RlpA family protein [Rhodopila sp.]|uniref:septal ring lytic transglycosylase RlpA family protein n=1 Tax=Rhodopila sp. TaxID=2480087 RepID=UPI003D14629D
MNGWRAATAAGWICVLLPYSTVAAPLPADAPGAKQEAERLDQLPPLPPAPAGHIDHSGRTQAGRASYYADSFANRKMANGQRMNPNANVAASKTLPLGSVAKVTNLRNGKTATVKIEDRGPYVDGRVVDLAPKVANQLDLTHQGVAPVVVKPVTLPQPDGQVKLGAGAADASPQEVQQAIEATRQLIAPNETAEK